MADLEQFLEQLADGERLDRAQSRDLFDGLVTGAAPPVQIAAMLIAMRVRGETVEELVGAVDAMRARMVRVQAAPGAIDVVGTGGDRSGSVNISTCAAFIAAGAGLPVAKHGNVKLSSRCGAADVLRALGVNIDGTPQAVERCIAQTGIGFMFAPAHHPALAAVMPVRRELKVRTIFNLLGPLLNPAQVRHHLIGVYDAKWLHPYAQALRDLGSSRAIIVHGHDGLDEITNCAATSCVVLADGVISEVTITPEELGFERRDPAALNGGDADANAQALRRVLHGEAGAYRDVALMNAAGALLAGGLADSWQDGVTQARTAVDEGLALRALERLVVTSNQSSESTPA